MLVLVAPPQLSSAHSVSARFAAAFEKAGIRCRYCELGPARPLRWMVKLQIPRSGTLYHALYGPLMRRRLRRLRESDIAWVYTNGTAINPRRPTHCCDAVHAQNAKHVFVLMDGWFHDTFLAPWATQLVEHSDLTAAVTPLLVTDVHERFPRASCDLFEEPIDTDVVRPCLDAIRFQENPPRVAWTGSAGNLRHLLEECTTDLCELQRRVPFVLRIIGARGADIADQPFPVERVPYSEDSEGHHISQCQAAINWIPDTPYAERKGHYKIKTYMAAGVATVTNPVGYAGTLLRDGTDGHLVRSKSEFIDRLQRLLQDKALAAALGDSARKRCVHQYSYPAQVDAYTRKLGKFFPREMEIAILERKDPQGIGGP